MRAMRSFLLLLFLGAGSTQGFAQGCIMCLTGAMSQGSDAIAALNQGVMILLIPPFLMLVGIFAFTFIRRS